MTDSFIELGSNDGVTVITINRPAKRNAINPEMCEDLRQAWCRFRDSDDRVAVLTAAGDIFTAGADLTNPPSQFWRALPDLGIDIGKPVIAAVNGPAIGMGVVLVGYCDMCVASTAARFIYPEARVGVAVGLISSFASRIPHKIAMELMLLGEPISARRAYETGMVNRLVEPGAHLDEAMKMAGGMARSAPLVLKFLKQMARDTRAKSPIEEMFMAQAEAEKVSLSQDALEGLAAFKEKRAPRFKGR
jgi:enoyl-CoA hydratase/carnithine racemase